MKSQEPEESPRALPTAADTETIQAPQEPTRTSAASIPREFADLRRGVDTLGMSVVDGHRSALALELEEAAARHSRESTAQLLEHLADERGLSWTAMARMLGVSLPALRKWRQGESISGENRGNVARLVALLEVLVERLRISDPASWLEIPIRRDVPLTRIEAHAAGRADLLLEFAEGAYSAEKLLDLLQPTWRKDYPPSRWEVFRAADGNLSVRERSESPDPLG